MPLGAIPETRRQGIVVVKLTDLDQEGCLPGFCIRVRETQRGCAVCSRVRHLVEELCKAIGHPFVFCCMWALKVLVLPAGEAVYLAFSRSPYMDEAHLKWVSETLGIPLPEVEAKWLAFSQFGREYVEEVIASLVQEGVDLPDSVLQSARNLGAAYGPYEVDIVTYTVLRGLSDCTNGSSGCLKIEFVAKREGKAVFRIITHRFDGTLSGSEIPIIGLATDEITDDLACLLDSPRFQKVSRDVAKAAFGSAFPDRARMTLLRKESGDSQWYGRVWGYSSGDQLAWPQPVTDRVVAGLHIGTRTALLPLLESLKAGGLGTWDTFRTLLTQFADPAVHPRVSHGQKTLWCQVLGDLKEAVEYFPAESAGGMLRTIRPTAERLLSTLQQFGVLDAAPVHKPDPALRRQVLAQDLLVAGSRYLIMLEDETLPLLLRRGRYAPSLVRQYLESHRDATVSALLETMRSGDISVEYEPGRGAWQTVVEFHQEYGMARELGRIEEQLYEVCAPGLEKAALGIYADLLGGLYKGVTLGTALANPVIEDIRRAAYHRYLTKRLGSNR